jgi:hypothetical protein
VTNFFEQHAERQMTGVAKHKAARTERRAAEQEIKLRPLTWQEKKLEDENYLAKLYRQMQAKIREDILEKHGGDFKELLKQIRALEWQRAPLLVEYLQTAWWLRMADADTRFLVTGLVTMSIVRSRIRAGLPAIDDGIPALFEGDAGGEPDCPSIQVMALLSED